MVLLLWWLKASSKRFYSIGCTRSIQNHQNCLAENIVVYSSSIATSSLRKTPKRETAAQKPGWPLVGQNVEIHAWLSVPICWSHKWPSYQFTENPKMINCQSPNATSGTHREWSRVQNEQVVIESEPDRPCVCGATCKIVLVFNTKTGPSSLCPIFIIATQSFIHFRPSPTQPSPFAVVAHASVTCTRMHRLMMMHARIASIWCPASFAARSGISSGDIDSVLSERHLPIHTRGQRHTCRVFRGAFSRSIEHTRTFSLHLL